MSPSAGVVARRCLLAVAVCGFVVFAALFMLSVARPHVIEVSARTLLVAEVERRTRERLDAVSESDSALAGLARKAMVAHAHEAAQLRRMKEALSERVSSTVDGMADPACACRAGLRDQARIRIDARLAQLDEWDARLEALIRSAYAHTANQLRREIRIFAGTNALVFLMLGVIAWRKQAVALHLLVPAVVLLGSVGVSAAFYLFNQDWVRTVVFNDYVGYGYAVWLGILLALLTDILANRARVTTRILNTVLHSAGSSLTVLPC